MSGLEALEAMGEALALQVEALRHQIASLRDVAREADESDEPTDTIAFTPPERSPERSDSGLGFINGDDGQAPTAEAPDGVRHGRRGTAKR